MIEQKTGQIHLLSGGAAQGLVNRLQESFLADSGFKIAGTFGAVGTMRDKLLGGQPCDVLILTDALIQELARQGWVDGRSARPLGVVRTGVAIKAGEKSPDVETPEALKKALHAAPGVYFPDPEKATAGIHFLKVLKSLGLDQALAARLRTYPNGAAAMREMAQAKETGVIGCTQVTEILHTPGVELIGLLPNEYELATVYTAAVCARAAEPAVAEALVSLLAGTTAQQVRAAVGFEKS